MKLNWNNLHLQSREGICIGACVSTKLASKSWEDLEPWLHELLASSMHQRSMGRVELGRQACVLSEVDQAKVKSVSAKSRTLVAKTKTTLRYTR